MNQLLEIEFNTNTEQTILRANGVQASHFQMTNVILFVPEVILPTDETTKLVKQTGSGNFVQELSWDSTEIIERTTNVVAKQPFNELLGTNLSGVNKVIAVVHDNCGSQEHEQICSGIEISDFNIEIDSKDYFNINSGTDREAYRMLADNFNIVGDDYNTGSLISISDWIERLRIYAIDLSRQEVFESDPNASQTIRVRGTPSAAVLLRVYIFKNK